MKIFLRYFLPWLLAAIFLIFLSTRSADELPKFDLWGIDKIFHFLYFLGLTLLTARLVFAGFKKNPKKKLTTQVLALLIAILFGLLDEGLQSQSMGRSVDLYDLIADSFGALAGVLLFPLYRQKVAEIEAELARKSRTR